MRPDQPLAIYDTTLRDGTQGEGISFSAADKILMATKIDQFGFDYIEGGWPGSNPRDMEFFRMMLDVPLHHARLTAFGSTCRAGVEAGSDPQLLQLIDAQTPAVTIFGKSWPLHVTEVLSTTLDENLRMIRDSVDFLRSNGREVIYDAEHFFDGYKADSDYALATLEAAVTGGAHYVVLCDTNGGTQLREFAEILQAVLPQLAGVGTGVHCHNDCGLGIALSLQAAYLGIGMIQGTLNGYGERVGNANLTTIIANLQLKMGYQLHCSPQIHRLREFSLEVDRLANVTSDKKEPFVGDSAFAHKGGVHANAAKKVAHSYEHIDPSLVGNRRRILLSDMSGSSSVNMKAREIGIDLEEKSPEMKAFLAKIKELENLGYEFENADGSFTVLLHQHFRQLKDNFDLVSYRTISEMVRGSGSSISEAVVKLQVPGEPDIKMSIAEASGPVGALDSAMREAFGHHFPAFKTVFLVDYKVRILQTGEGTRSIVQVLMKSSDGADSWWTCGADGSIIEASYQALCDSFRYKLIKEGLSEKQVV